MTRTSRGLFLVLVVVLSLSGRAMASTTASITVNGAEQSGDANTITVAFDGFAETVHYGQFSSPASIASALAGMFSRDYLQAGLCAAVTSAGGSTINFKLRGGAVFGPLDVTGSTTSFTMSGSGFASQESTTTPDTGTVTLTVSNLGGAVFSKTTNYGEGATTSSVAGGLAGSSSNVTVTAVNDTLYIQASGQGATTDYSYAISSSWNSFFSQPSFQGSPASGSLTGGANSGGSQQTIYSYCISSSAGPSCPSTPSGGYDPAGNVLNYYDSVMGTWNMTTSSGSGSDSLNRLTVAKNTGTTATSTEYANKYGCWAYDSFGNRTASYLQTTACPAQESSLTPTDNFNANNQMDVGTKTYDAAGNMTVNSATGNTYLYDGEGRICAVKSEPVAGTYFMTGYVYDAVGNRVAKGTITSMSCDPSANGFVAAGNVTDYVLGPGGEQVSELAQDADGSMKWQRTYVYAANGLFATYDPSSDSPSQPLPSFRLTDWLGTLRATTDWTGIPQGTCTSLPFGDQLACQGNIPDPRYFTGKERDQESGNDYFGARYYSSSMGRFLSPDPAGVLVADLANPQSWNFYSYVLNNPLVLIDPTGLAYTFSCYSDPPTDKTSTSIDDHGDIVTSMIFNPGAQHCTFWDDGSGWNGPSPTKIPLRQPQSLRNLPLQCPGSGLTLGQRASLLIAGTANFTLGESKTPTGIVLAVGGTLSGPATDGGGFVAGAFGIYDTITSEAQAATGAAQFYEGYTGDTANGERMIQAGEIANGPLLGVSTYLLTKDAAKAQSNANWESLALLGVGALKNGSVSEGIKTLADEILELGGLDPEQCAP
jgi:RHS repeat-associated protein